MVLLTVAVTTLHDKYYNPQESSIVYYSPKTTMVFDFTYQEKTYEKGPFAQYAEELLGIENAVTENKTTYQMKHVSILTRTDVDLERAHKVSAEAGVPIQLLTITDKGLLKGYNLPEGGKNRDKNTNTSTERSKAKQETVPSFPEEILEAKSEAEQAQLIAKQIFRLRETRTYLLSGEVEHAPADGTAMKLVLDELDKQEKQFVSLFTGKTTTTIKHKKVNYCPSEQTGKVYKEQLFFSEENGFTDAENIDAQKVVIQAVFQRQHIDTVVTEVPKDKKGKKTIEPSQIVYNLPGYANVVVTYKNETMATKTMPIAQFGIDMPLSKDLFTGKELPVIVVSEKTGNIVSISK